MKLIPAALLVLITMPLLIFGKGETYKITLSGEGQTLEITDAKALQEFGFGSGPGNFGAGRVPAWRPNSWIVEDWDHPVVAPDHVYPRLKVAFHVKPVNDGGSREYVVYYAYDPNAHQGYVYLPGKGEPSYRENVSLIIRGAAFDGRWFRATPSWTEKVQSVLERVGN